MLAAERQTILNEARELSDELRRARDRKADVEERKSISQRRTRLWEEYAELLPFVPVSRCPICGEVVELPMDVQGLDGPWWWKLSPIQIPAAQSCEHFKVHLGALNLHGRKPTEVYEGVTPGPDVPYVIDRMLGPDDMRAVLSEVRLKTGDAAYLIAYYAEDPKQPDELHQEWLREFFALRDGEGNAVASTTKTDPWDFDIDPWIERGKLLWIEPGDSALSLRHEVPSPYSNLQGHRKNQLLAGGRLMLLPPPSGGEVAIYERD